MKDTSPIRQALVCLSYGLFLAGMLTACGGNKSIDEQAFEAMTAEELYGRAKEAMIDNSWSEAITRLRQLEARYPYGQFAKQAQLDTAYAYYKRDEVGLALTAADRFISLNPTHPSIDYAYYIKGLSNFNERSGVRSTLSGRTDLSDRDPQSIHDAITAFTTVTDRFPNSEYATDSRERIQYLNSALAKHEISVAKFYFERQAYVAAVNRANAVLEDFPGNPEVESALAVLVYSYEQMGLAELSTDSRRILEANYPSSLYLTTPLSQQPLLKRLFN